MQRISTYISDNSQIFPIRWEIWRGLISRYELAGDLPIGGWISIMAILATAFIQNPDDIASLSRQGAMTVCATFFHRGKILVLWKAFKCLCETSTQQLGPLQLHTESTKMAAEPIRGGTVEATDIRLSYQEYKHTLQLGPNFDKLTPTTRTERLDDPLDRNIVDLLLKTGDKLNILRAGKGSLPSVASGSNNYIRFCKLVRRPFFIVAEETVKIRSSAFNPGKTFKMYQEHL